MKQHRILGVAPNESIYYLMMEVSQNHPDVILDSKMGNLEDGCAIVQQYGERYDCIISRGGTAEQIRAISVKPVVEIEFSAYDLLQSINLARSCSEKWAIVGFPSITKNARIISDLLQYNLDIFTLHAKEDTEIVFAQLKCQGYQIIVCDTITDIYAKRQGMDSILIHSGMESVERAVDEAIHICEANDRIKEQKDLYEMLLSNLEIDSFVFNAQKQCVYSSVAPTDKTELYEIIQSQVSLPEREQSAVIQKKIQGTIYSIEAKQVEFREEMYSLYNIYHQKNKTTKKAGGIQYYTASELNKTILSDYYFSPNLQLAKYEQMDQPGMCPPLVILGQPGTGKQAVSAYLHMKGKNWNKPYIDCDFSQINEKELQYLLDSLNSPFWSNQMTFYFHEMESLDDKRFEEFLASLQYSHLCNRNRVIFSWIHNGNERIPSRLHRVMDLFTCFTLRLPSLSERTEELPRIVNKYINSFNSAMAKHSSGVMPEAMALLKAYNWPGNLSQLKRVIFQAFSESEGLYIMKETLQPILEMEKRQLIPETELCLDLSGTLDEIKRKAVRVVLAQCGNNQSKAAERLGISRSTLWRMLGNG